MRILLLVVSTISACAAQPVPPPTHLQVENRTDPRGMDVLTPHLSWTVAGIQSAYQVRASTDSGPLWDSGMVNSSSANGVAYAGPRLRSRMRVSWQVRVWTADAGPSEWSNPAFWEMGLLDASDWSAKWIANRSSSYEKPLPVFTRQFTLTKTIDRARLYVTGVGAYDATLNGKAVTEDVLAPGNTKFSTRIEYAACDVASQLNPGRNTLQVELGNGSFNAVATPGHYMDFVNDFSVPLRMLAQLEIRYADGTSETIVSDETWRTTLGATILSTWYGGEEYDARREPGDPSSWDVAVPISAPAPNTQLSWRLAPPVRIVGTVHTQAITQPVPGTYVFDMGVNFAGWFELRVSGAAGTRITFRIAEQLQKNGTVDQSQFESPVHPVYPIVDAYTLSGKGTEVWRPKFAYHGFRYVEVTGLPGPPDTGTITGYILRGANEAVGTFDSSNDLLNSIHRIIDRAIQSNMMSIFTDCPDREKLGWLADMQGIFGSIARNYDIAAYARNIVRNMADGQTETGLVPDFVPEYVIYTEGFRDDPNWGDAMILTPWSMYETYGDSAILETYYPQMQRYLEYLRSKSKGNLLTYGLNDWITPDRTLPDAVTATYAYYRSADTIRRIAEVLKRPLDVDRYGALARDIAAAFNATYTGDGHQATDAFALDMGILAGDQRTTVLDHLITDIRERGNHVNVGIVALGPLFRALSAAGRDDVIFDIATQTTHPSYGYQVVNGATSLAELWDGTVTALGSQNHMMLGAIDEWFTAGLAGIRQSSGSIGYRSIEIRPAVVGDLRHVYGSYRSVNGLIESEWTRDADGNVSFRVTVPGNTTALILVPGQDAQFVGPGTYQFRSFVGFSSQ
jgi:alpha-L-rhamnosidase